MQQNILEVDDQKVYFTSSENIPTTVKTKVDLFITSPPYWNLKNYGHANEIGREDYEKYLVRMNKVWVNCFELARDGAILVINVNSRRVNKQFYPIAYDIVKVMEKWVLWDEVIWYIPNALPQPNHYQEKLLDNKFETCLVFVKGDIDKMKFHKPRVPQKYNGADPRKHKLNPNGRCIGNIIRIPAYRPPNVKQLSYHIAAYPEELAAFFIECYTDKNDVVCDPFLGSGTTLKVARVMARKGIGFEINENYKALIKEKILENWEVPDWKMVDIIHSSTNEPGMKGTRKSHFRKINDKDLSLDLN